MNESKIAVRYAKSLFLHAKEINVLNAIKDDMLFIQDLCGIDEFMNVLESPVVKTSQKQQIIKEIVKDHVSVLTLSFLLLVLKNKREYHLKGIVRDFIHQYKSFIGVKTAVLTTAYQIDNDARIKIVDFIKRIFKTNVELNELINKDVIGGYILRIEDQQIDASLSTKLNKLKQKLVNSTI
jgi:F-type H+-transporting ATPase subunit delta